MSLGTSQTLTVQHARVGASYHWEITSGGGNLDKTVGGSVVYTAPATNPGCVNNPTIQLTTDTKGCFVNPLCAEAKISLNGYSAVAAYKYVQDSCFRPSGYPPNCKVGYHRFGLRCNATEFEDISNYADGTDNVLATCCAEARETVSPTWGSWVDSRSEAALAGGCCPYQLM